MNDIFKFNPVYVKEYAECYKKLEEINEDIITIKSVLAIHCDEETKDSISNIINNIWRMRLAIGIAYNDGLEQEKILFGE